MVPGAAGESPRDRGMYSLTVAEVVRETADASSFVLDIPADLADRYRYRAGQFLTLSVELDGVRHLRSYSMSSSPHTDARLRITVKRVRDGVVSNWMNDMLTPGSRLTATVPAGTFVLDHDNADHDTTDTANDNGNHDGNHDSGSGSKDSGDGGSSSNDSGDGRSGDGGDGRSDGSGDGRSGGGCDMNGGGDIVAFAGGSGITPILSIIKTALATSPTRRVRLLYANRDQASVIFAAELADLAARHPDRLTVHHHHDTDRGLLDQATVTAFLTPPPDPTATGFTGPAGRRAGYFVCGPEAFMDCVQKALAGSGVDEARVRVERFTPAENVLSGQSASSGAVCTAVVIRLGRRTVEGNHRPGATILQTARLLGLKPPSSCEGGSCATCMAQVVEGSAVMRNNEALTPEEIAAGWVLTCQAVPDSPSIRVVYE